MEFFNKLQDVILFSLTQYGKKMFASGTFNPVYYSFGDNNIVYDSNVYGISGSQNQTADQIDALIRPKLNTYLATTVFNQQNKYGSQLTPYILGTAELGQQKYPALQLKLHNGHFSGTAQSITSTFGSQNVNELHIELICNFDTSSKEFTSHEYILMEITELNGIYEKENFDVQFFKRKRSSPVALFNNVLHNIDVPLSTTEVVDIDTVFEGNGNFALGEGIDIENDSINYWFVVETDEYISDDITFDNLNNDNIYLKPENNLPVDNC